MHSCGCGGRRIDAKSAEYEKRGLQHQAPMHARQALDFKGSAASIMGVNFTAPHR